MEEITAQSSRNVHNQPPSLDIIWKLFVLLQGKAIVPLPLNVNTREEAALSSAVYFQ